MKVADMHCDTISELYANRERGWSLAENELHIRLDKMQKGDYLLQNFALFIYNKEGTDPYREALALADCFDRQMELFPEQIDQVRSWADIEKNAREGRISALLTMEEGAACQGSLKKLQEFYRRGVRMLTLTWNFPNEIGHPNVRLTGEAGEKPDFLTPETEHGLTEFGITAVEEMEQLGMIIDVSHLSDAGFYDVLRHTKRPFVASHSNARAVCPMVRNLTDDMLYRLGERGGVTGLNFCADFLTLPRHNGAGIKLPNPGTVDAVVRHAVHIVNAGGSECLGLGSDFDGITTHAELTGADCMPVLDHALQKAGFCASQREKIFSKNVLRVYRELL